MFDLHVHSAPDLFPRWGDDAATADAYARAGFRGFVLKGHAEPTAGRAAAVRGIAAYGGIVLNEAVGGLNPSAVAAALGHGARVVWMPTLDARAHREAGLPRPPDACGSGSLAIPPADRGAEPRVRAILRLVADADAVIATGHVSGAEAAWLVRAAREAGVRRVLLTHASFSVPALAAPAVRELQELGAVAEITAYQLLHQPGVSAAGLAELVRALDPARCVLSSDAGQPDSPPPPEALERLVDALAAEGVDRGALLAMAGEAAARLVVVR